MNNTSVLLVIKTGKKEDLILPKEYEGLINPYLFSHSEYLTWKDLEREPGQCDSWLEKTFGSFDKHVIKELYARVKAKFVSYIDREYMMYARYLVDPKCEKGILQASEYDLRYGCDGYDEDYDNYYYPPIHDPMFNPEYPIFHNFCTVLRHVAVRKKGEVPKYIYKALDLDGIDSEFALCYPLPFECWKDLSKWEPVRSFIDANRSKMPLISKLLAMYGEPTAVSASMSAFSLDRYFVDIVAMDVARSYILATKDQYEEKSIKVYEV